MLVTSHSCTLPLGVLLDDGALHKCICSSCNVQAGLVGHACTIKEYKHRIIENERPLSTCTDITWSITVAMQHALLNKAVTYHLEGR